MSKETAEKAVDFMMSKNDGVIRNIILFGGEPTLNIDAIEAMFDRYIYHKERGNTSILIFDINTNGTIISDRFINALKKIKKWTSFEFSVSVNGDEKSHNHSRFDINGNPTHKIVMENLYRLRKEIPDLYIDAHSVLDKTFLDNFEDNLKFFENEEVFNSASAELAYWNTSDSTITEDDLIKYKNIFLKLSRSGKITKKIECMFDPILKLEDISNRNCCSKACEVCVPAINTMDILPNGDFIPCDYFLGCENYKEFTLGNINEDLSNYNSSIQKYKDKYSLLKLGKIKIKSENGTICEECKYSNYCFVCSPILEMENDKDNSFIVPLGLCERNKMIANIFKLKE